MPRWFTARPSEAVPPLAVQVNPDPVVQSAATVGLEFPEREADCTGARPAWYPVVFNVCDQDEPDSPDLTVRQRTT